MDFDPLRVQAIANAQVLLASPTMNLLSPATPAVKTEGSPRDRMLSNSSVPPGGSRVPQPPPAPSSPRDGSKSARTFRSHKGPYVYQPPDNLDSIHKSIQDSHIEYAPAFKSAQQRPGLALNHLDVRYNIHHDERFNLLSISDKADVDRLVSSPRRYATWYTDFHPHIPSQSCGHKPVDERWCKYVRMGDKYENLYEKLKGNSYRDTLRKPVPEPTDPLLYNKNYGKYASTIERVEKSPQRMAIVRQPRYHRKGIYVQQVHRMTPDIDQGNKKSIMKSVEDSAISYRSCFKPRFRERPQTSGAWELLDVKEVSSNRKPISQNIEETPFKLSNVRSTVPRWKKEKERSPYDVEKMSMMIKKSRMYLIERKKNIRIAKAMGKDPEKKPKVDTDIPQIIADKVREYDRLAKLSENNPVPGPGHDVEIIKSYADNWRRKEEELRKAENEQLYEGNSAQKHRYTNEDLVAWVNSRPPEPDYEDMEGDDLEEKRRMFREQEKRKEREKNKMKKKATRDKKSTLSLLSNSSSPQRRGL